MVVLLVIATFFILLVVDIFVIYPRQERKKAEKVKPEIFYNPEVGYTMADGGELIKEKNDNNDKSE